MRTIGVAVLLLVVTSLPALAQYELQFYADEAATSCELSVPAPGLVKVHMLVTGQGLVGGVAFKAVKPPCMENATWISDIWQGMYAYSGNTQATVGLNNGVDVVLNCGPLPRYIGWIWFSVTGPIPSCCTYAPQPGSNSPGNAYPMEIVLLDDCTPAAQTHEAPMTGRGLVINADASCACNLPVATRPSTWGAVKGLYR